MADRFSVGHLYPSRLPPAAPGRRSDLGSRMSGIDTQSFRDVLEHNLVRVSHHAEVRLQQRGIELKPEQLAKIDSAIDKAAAKGSREALLLMDNMAMIVNVKSKTIVTAMDGAAMKNNVFTQIDSAVIIS